MRRRANNSQRNSNSSGSGHKEESRCINGGSLGVAAGHAAIHRELAAVMLASGRLAFLLRIGIVGTLLRRVTVKRAHAI